MVPECGISAFLSWVILNVLTTVVDVSFWYCYMSLNCCWAYKMYILCKMYFLNIFMVFKYYGC